MATIALRTSTVEADSEGKLHTIPSGHSYNLFSEPRITARELVTEKVAGECRKARAGGSHTASLDRLSGHGMPTFDGPLDQQLLVAQTLNRVVAGDVVLLVDNKHVTDLDTVIELTRRTCIQFVVRENNFGGQA